MITIFTKELVDSKLVKLNPAKSFLIDAKETNQLIDCNNEDIEEIKIKKNITAKKIKSIEVLIKVASDNQNQN